MLFLCTHIHTPENCGLHNPEKMKENVAQMVQYAEENKVKVISVLDNAPNHRIIFILDTDSAEKLKGFFAPMLTMGNIDITPVSDTLVSLSINQ